MATILLTWEMGSGIGHMMSLRPIGVELIRRGHRVVAALKDLTHAHDIFAGTGIAVIPAPVIKPSFRTRPGHRGLVEVLRDMGLGDDTIAGAEFLAWNSIFELVKPQLVVVDNSPFALLALRGLSIPRVNVGLGFFCPPDAFPLPIWNGPRIADSLQELPQIERDLTERVNSFLRANKRSELKHLAALFSEVEEVILATYRELDHFGHRPAMRYWGHWPFGAEFRPPWPTGHGPKIYAYLKPFAGLESLLQFLKELGNPTLVFSGGIDPPIQERFSSSNLRFENRPVDLKYAAEVCGLSITHAGHGTLASFLLAGKPCVMIPPFVEQRLLAGRVEMLGAGRMALGNNAAGLQNAVNEVMSNPAYRVAAQAFAQRYGDWVPGQQIPSLVDRLEQLVRQGTAN